MTLLSVEGLRKEFEGVVALDDASLDLEAGELVGLIGPNGAGKTTLFDCVSGVLAPTVGTVRFNGRDVTGDRPYQLARQGLVRTYQQTRELETMTVRENVMLPALDHPGERALPALARTKSVAERETEARERTDELLERFDLDHLAEEYAGNLSGGQRKLLEVARALVLDPDLLLLDEPLAGVNPTLSRRIVDYVTRLNDEGMTFLIVEHEIGTLVGLVDRLVVLDQGSVLASGDPDDVVRRDDVIDAYLGDSVADV